MNNNKIIAILGPASAGKDTVRNMLLIRNKDLVVATSHTTRPKRATENGSEYYFIDVNTFHDMDMRGDFIETRTYDVIADGGGLETWYYGYSIEEIDNKLSQGDILMIVDLDGFKSFKQLYGDRCIGIYLNVDRDIRIKRYIERDRITWKNVCEAVRRIEDDDNRAFKGYEDWVDYVIDTDNSEYSVQRIEEIL